MRSISNLWPIDRSLKHLASVAEWIPAFAGMTGGSLIPSNPAFLSCLCGSEQIFDSIIAQLEFLSCLCGSELGLSSDYSPAKFLSCLCGSERL